MSRLKFIILLILLPVCLMAQEGRYGHFSYQRPPSDLERQGIHGNVRVVISYEGIASRTNRGVVFSEDPLKNITLYNKHGNMMRKETYRNNKLVETTTYKYDSQGVLISKVTTQANGIANATVRFFNDHKTQLCGQMNCYNFAGKLSQMSKFTYNANKNVVAQIDFGPTGVKKSALYSEYDSENRLVLEQDYEYHKYGADSVLYYKAEYTYNSHNNVAMRTNSTLKPDGSEYDIKIRHYRYYQYDKNDNWRISCIYYNALENDNRLVPQNMIVREIEYY